MSKKRLAWRCANAQQQRDKAEIYNSREWRELRVAKLRDKPLCQMCEEKQRYVSAHCVHHIIPIETAKTKEEMRRLAFNQTNLMSLCDECHASIHKEAGKGTTQLRRERAEARQERWKDSLVRMFTTEPSPKPEPENHGRIV